MRRDLASCAPERETHEPASRPVPVPAPDADAVPSPAPDADAAPAGDAAPAAADAEPSDPPATLRGVASRHERPPLPERPRRESLAGEAARRAHLP